MPPERNISFASRVVLSLIIVILIPACATLTPVTARTTVEPVTPTPEVFSPLSPSPTPSDSTLPSSCQVTDLAVYIDEEWGYCFAYPGIFTVDDSAAGNGILNLHGPALEDSADPIRVSLELTVQPVPAGSDLTRLVDAYLTLFENVAIPWTITRESARLGIEPAETLDPIPGLLSSRVVMALHDNLLFTLRFHPSDIELARPGLDDLTQTVTGSFAFLPRAEQAARSQQVINWFEFGATISLTYDPALAPWVEAQTVPAVPLSDQVLFAEAHPTYAQVRFVGFQGGRAYDLPLLASKERVAQVMGFQTADFAGFGDNSPQGFASQLQVLQNLLETGLDPARCAVPIAGEPVLPFLPWINMKQALCARPQIVEFANGRGVRYLAYYSQGPGPVLDSQVFYTFQGLTDDGRFYVAALFPVATGIFPVEAPACPRCAEPGYNPSADWLAVTTEQLDRLNARPADDFSPSLTVLDKLIMSLQMGE